MPPWGHSLRKDAKYNFAGLTYWQPKVFLLKHVQDHQDPVQPHLFGLTPQPPFYLLILPNTIYWPACFTAGKNWIPKCMSPMSLLPKRPLRHSRTMKPHHPQNYPPDTMQACKSYWSRAYSSALHRVASFCSAGSVRSVLRFCKKLSWHLHRLVGSTAATLLQGKK